MNFEKYGGRRFLLTVVSGIGTFALVLLGKITGEVYATVTIATVASYITGNTAQKFSDARAKAA
jgi:hypothetical protein